MSYKIYIILLIMGMINLVNAESINEQIEAVKNANPKERVEMMNRLKAQIAKMNEQERFNTLEMIQKNMNFQNKGFQNSIRNKNINDRNNKSHQFRFKSGASMGVKQQGNH
ncbi:MAG: hypothetical protein A3G74_07240 [Sulfurimonas sp. RIFCSPLOWO2_12_FULL_34_6]|nr:MAG: hypothetical protein A3G74_07240 [Sulfurimonas sp. RIFCSPLOWO2_12_FULL_34_6]